MEAEEISENRPQNQQICCDDPLWTVLRPSPFSQTMITSKMDLLPKSQKPEAIVLLASKEVKGGQDNRLSFDLQANNLMLFNTGHSPHGQLVQVPKRTIDQVPKRTIKQKDPKPTYRCSQCSQEYSQARLTSHVCENHLKRFKAFKRQPQTNRYEYRCLVQLCDWKGRKSFTKAHHLFHQSKNETQLIPQNSNLYQSTMMMNEERAEALKAFQERIERQAKQNPQNWGGKDYFRFFRQCKDKWQKPGADEKGLLIFLAILFKQTKKSAIIVKRKFQRSLLCHLGFSTELKISLKSDRFKYNWIAARFIEKQINSQIENGDILLVIRRQLVLESLKILVESYFWTQDQLKAAGRYSIYLRAETRRHSIPQHMKSVDQTCRNYRQRHKRLTSKRTRQIKKYRSSMIFKKYYHQSYIKHWYRAQRLKRQKFVLKISNVFEEPVKTNHRKQRQKQQLQLVKQINFRAIADFLSFQRSHLQCMGLFQLLKEKRRSMQDWDECLVTTGFNVAFPPLRHPHQLLLDNQWYIIPEDFFKLFRNWLPAVYQAQRKRFADFIPFPELTDGEIVRQSEEWLKKNKLWMPSKESHGVYEQIHFWDITALRGHWQQMREQKLKQYKQRVLEQPEPQHKFGDEFKILEKDQIILRQDNRPLPGAINPLMILPPPETTILLRNESLWQKITFPQLQTIHVRRQQLVSTELDQINRFRDCNVLCFLCSKWVSLDCYRCTHCAVVYHDHCLNYYLDKEYIGGKCSSCRQGQPFIRQKIGISLPDLIRKGNSKLVYSQFPSRWFKKLKQSKEQENTSFNEEINKLQQYYKCQYIVFNKYHWNLEFYPAWNPPSSFNIINRHDYIDLIHLSERRAILPIRIVQTQSKGRGIAAARDIAQKELVAVYSGILMSSVAAQRIDHLKDYIVAAFEGPGTQQTSVIVPHYFAGFGHILNGAGSSSHECNCEIANFLCLNGLVSLLRAKRDILKGEELQWDYNGRYEEYDMNFEVKAEHEDPKILQSE